MTPPARILAVRARFAKRELRQQVDHLRALLEQIEDANANASQLQVEDGETHHRIGVHLAEAEVAVEATVDSVTELLQDITDYALGAEKSARVAAEAGAAADSHREAAHMEAAGRILARSVKLAQDAARGLWLYDLLGATDSRDRLSAAIEAAVEVVDLIEDVGSRDRQNGTAEEDGVIDAREQGEREAAEDAYAIDGPCTLAPAKHRPERWPLKR